MLLSEPRQVPNAGSLQESPEGVSGDEPLKMGSRHMCPPLPLCTGTASVVQCTSWAKGPGCPLGWQSGPGKWGR